MGPNDSSPLLVLCMLFCECVCVCRYGINLDSGIDRLPSKILIATEPDT